MNLSEAENENQRLKHSDDEVINDTEEQNKLKSKILIHEEDKTKLKRDLEAAEKKWKVLNQQVKEKDKEIHDLKKENGSS